MDLPVIVLGMGGVGRSLLSQILEKRAFHKREYDLSLQILCLCDSRSSMADGRVLGDEQIHQALKLKEEGSSLATHPLGVVAEDLKDPVGEMVKQGTIVVDCTASSAIIPLLLSAVDRGCKIVLANKKPLTAEQEVYDHLVRTTLPAPSPIHGVRNLTVSRWEATVGSGLPIIATLNRLVCSGDEIHHIAGNFSSTVGFITTGLQKGRPFSQMVGEAHSSGYTEPDPREDLAGLDMARKALILARGLGWKMELSEIDLVGLYPSSFASLPLKSFLQRLPELDHDFEEQIQEAAAQDKVLRYFANIEKGGIRVGLAAVHIDTPLGRLEGTDNIIEISSRWYPTTPLVIQGRGAGVHATAAGVLSDIVELAFTG